jgi:hypothetical protein
VTDRQASDAFGEGFRLSRRGLRLAAAMALTAFLVLGIFVFVRSRPKPIAVDRRDACPMLDKTEVATVTKRKVYSLDPEPGPLAKRLCVVSFVGTETLKLYTSRDGGPPVFESAAADNIPGDRTDIAGVGDDAKWLHGAQAMVVRSRNDTFTIVTLGLSGSEQEHQSIARRLAPSVIRRLRASASPSRTTTTKR